MRLLRLLFGLEQGLLSEQLLLHAALQDGLLPELGGPFLPHVADMVKLRSDPG
jgi:hypothetical protein